MTQNKSNLEVVTAAMQLSGAKNLGELVTEIHRHGVSNATELLEKLGGDPRG